MALPIQSGGFNVSLSLSNTANSTFTNIPVAVRITSGDVPWSSIGSSGSDIRFSAADKSTGLNFFFEKFDYTNSLAIIWVLVPSILPLSSQTIYMWFGGNPIYSTVTASYDAVFAKIDRTNTGLIALHHLDEGTGTTSADSVGSFTATLVASPTWNANDGGNFATKNPVQRFVSGSAIALNGTSQYISIPGLLDTQPVNGVTVSMWLMSTGTNVLGTNIWRKQNDANNGFYCQFDSNGCPRYAIATGSGFLTNYNGNHVIPLNKWVHLCFTYGPGGLRTYVDGESDAIVPSVTGVPGNGSSFPVQIGAETVGNGAGEFWFTGQIDEVAHWNRQLAEWEVKALFRRRPLVQIADAFSKLVNQSNPVIAGPSGHGILESNPIVISAGSSYRNYIHDLTTNRILYYTSTNGISWTLVNSDVLSHLAVDPTVWVDPNGLWHMTVNLSGAYVVGNLAHYTSVDGVTNWTQQADVLVTGAGFLGYFATAILYNAPGGGVWFLCEYLKSAGLYVTGFWKGNDINSLVYQKDTSGLIYGGRPQVFHVGNKFYTVNHGGVIPGLNNIPTVGQVQVSTDLDHDQDGCINPIIQLHGPPYEGDQVADIRAIENYDGNGNLAVYWTGSRDGSTGSNIGNGYAIMMATFAGTFQQWITDNLAPSFGTVQAAPTTVTVSSIGYYALLMIWGGYDVLQLSPNIDYASSITTVMAGPFASYYLGVLGLFTALGQPII